MNDKPEESDRSGSASEPFDGSAESAVNADQDIEIEQAAEAGTPEAGVGPTAAEVAPAGASAGPQQPQMDLTADPVHRGLRRSVADPRSLTETKDTFALGPLRITRWGRVVAVDTSFQAAGISMLSFSSAGVFSGVVIAATSEVLADPSGEDLLLLGGVPGGGIILLGIALNTWRLFRSKS